MRTLCSRDGGHLPTLKEVSAHIRVGAPWVGDRDLPDLDSWADFGAAPKLVHQRLVSRLANGQCPSVTNTLPLSKPGKAELRNMAWLNPYDELYYRIIVGRVASTVDAALGQDVYSYRLRDASPAWVTKDARQAFQRRLERGKQLLSDPRCHAMAVSDIRNYYPSIKPQILETVLDQTGAPHGAVRLIDRFLRELALRGAPSGLPVGPEASGLLGNIALLGLDDSMAEHVLGHVRYMDDSWLYLQSESEWPEVYDTYSAVVSTLGLEVNRSKVEIHSRVGDDAEQAMQHGHIAYLVSGSSSYRTPQMATRELRSLLDKDKPDWTLVKFFLGSLRSQESTNGLVILYDHPNMLHEIPLSVGKYLVALTANRESRRKIDRDWLVERATGTCSPRSLAGQLQVCRAASHIQTGKDHGRLLEELATDTRLRPHVPLQAWAARAWGSSKAYKPGRAVEHACHQGDFSVRRSFALTLHPGSSTSTRRSTWKRKLLSVEPDLAPTLARLD